MHQAMDYFGQVLDDLTDLYEEIEASPHVEDASRLLRSLERTMKIAVEIEVQRRPRLKVEPLPVQIATAAKPYRLSPAPPPTVRSSPFSREPMKSRPDARPSGPERHP